MGAASLVAILLWHGTTRPMADTVSYRTAARLLTEGWPALPDRTPGYPVLLILTGSTDHSTTLLFFVQLLMHLATVCLVVDLAGRVGVGRRGRVVLTVLLMAPAVLLRAVYEGTEGLSALLLTLVCWWLFTPPPPERATRRAIALGVVCGVAALVRPTFVLLFVPVAVLAMVQRHGVRPRTWRWGTAVVVALPALLIVGGLSAFNAVHFDSPGLTPMMPWHLSSRTSPYVENLPSSYEPARSVLIRERDQALLRGENMAPGNFIYHARDELQRVTGKSGRELDRYVLEMDVVLIANNPFAYADTVMTATVNYAGIDSQPAILGLGRPVAWAQQFAHLVLLAAFLGIMALWSGLALAGRVERAMLRLALVGSTLSLYVLAVSVMVETGTARLRAPTEPILALLLVVGASVVRSALRRRRASNGDSNDRSDGDRRLLARPGGA
jgi:hypothetical protein